jgi:predicted  nucleic acid-binding Zn-ribbon protein
VIEYALLFGLGFLAAAFLGFLISPAIHRRIVSYTENRMRATMPLSPQEVRAQKDMARALYAAENARTTQELVREREKSLSLQLKHDSIARDAGHFASEIGALQAQIGDMSVEAAELRSHLRKDENYISQLKTSLHIVEQASSAKEGELDALRTRLNRLAEQADGLKIDMATRETEIESLTLKSNALRAERDNLRQDVNLLKKRAKDAEQKLTHQEHAVLRLEDKAERDATALSDNAALLSRRQQEISRLREQLKAVNADLRKANRSLRSAGLTPVLAEPASQKRAAAGDAPVSEPDTAAVAARLAEEVRARSAAVSERLLGATTNATGDGAIREEIATIAASMVALTAINEGPSSPIRDLLPDGATTQEGERIDLAQRAATILSEPG